MYFEWIKENHVRMVIFGHVHRYIAILPNSENRIQIYAHMRKYAAKTYVVDKIEGNDRLDHWKKFRRPPNNMFNAKSGFEFYDVHSTLSKQWSHLFIYASESYVNQAYHLKCPINQQNYACWFKPLSIFRNWANDAIFTSTMIQKCPKIVRTWFVSCTARYRNPNSIWFLSRSYSCHMTQSHRMVA